MPEHTEYKYYIHFCLFIKVTFSSYVTTTAGSEKK